MAKKVKLSLSPNIDGFTGIMPVNSSLRGKLKFNFFLRFSVCDSQWVLKIEPTISDPVTSFGHLN